MYRVAIALVLLILTQVGFLSYLLSSTACYVKKVKNTYFRTLLHLCTYLVFTFILVPPIAMFFGREPVKNTHNLQPANYILTVGLNRNYVVPELNDILLSVSDGLSDLDTDIKLFYLDASFPLVDGFPLLPHLSHNNGRKIDLSYIYAGVDGNIAQYSASRSGYGFFEGPLANENDTNRFCKDNGYFQYDYPKYLTLGIRDTNLVFSEPWNRKLASILLSQKGINKVFIEPHLVDRLALSDARIRFHGCRAVRHDDHIHIQI